MLQRHFFVSRLCGDMAWTGYRPGAHPRALKQRDLALQRSLYFDRTLQGQGTGRAQWPGRASGRSGSASSRCSAALFSALPREKVLGP